MNKEFEKEAHRTKWIACKDLSVTWAQAQREFDAKHAASIAGNFDPDMFGVLSVTLPNENGIYHIIDGQHRKEAVQQMFGDQEQVPCNVFDANDPARAAEIFDKINTARKNPKPIDKFKIRVTARYHTESAVARIVEEAGFRIVRGSANGTISAVNALTGIYKQFGPKTLRDTLDMLRLTWRDNHAAYEASLLRGYAAFMASFSHVIDSDRLARVVKKNFPAPGDLKGAAKSAREVVETGTITASIRAVLIKNYNTGLRSGTPLSESRAAKVKGVAKTEFAHTTQ